MFNNDDIETTHVKNDDEKESRRFMENSNITIKKNTNEKKENIILLFHFLLLLSFKLIVIYYYFSKGEIPTNFKYKYFKRLFKFDYLLPRTNMNHWKNKTIPNLYEIFNSRRLYINGENISKEYIQYIRPIDEKEEEEYKKELYPNLEPNLNFDENRINYIKTSEFVEICNSNKLISTGKVVASSSPDISLIVPSFNKKTELMQSVRSIQNQSFKNIEIIIIDDCSTDDTRILYEELLNTDPRVRIFYHMKNLGVFRTRIDGFLYSRGKYILHFDPGDLYADNLILEDMYNTITKYNLDSVRFSFRMIEIRANGVNVVFKKVYPQKFLKIQYGPVYHNVHVLGYGTIWDRIVRKNIFTKGLCLFDEVILNSYKNMWEDMWWNQFTNHVSNNHLVVNRIGYMYYSSALGEGNVKIRTEKLRNRTIKEFILFWLFDLELLSKEDDKIDIIDKLRRYNLTTNSFHGTPMHLDYLSEKNPVYEELLNRLINDPYVNIEDKEFVNKLLQEYKLKFRIQ